MRTRRQALSLASGIVLGGTGISLLSQESEAMDVGIDGLGVADTNREAANPVAAVQLSVSGEYSYETSVDPSRVVLRLEVEHSGEWAQVDALAVRENLPRSQRSEYSLSGNILKHRKLTPSDFTPSNRGESKSIDVGVRVKMSVSSVDGKIGEEVVRDSASIRVTKTAAEVSMQVGGSGEVGITTES